MLRNLIQGFAVLLLAGAVLLTGFYPFAWPYLLMAAIFAVGVFYERVFYRGAGTPRGQGWEATAERFRDQESGAMVTVWFNSRTGERLYVEDGADLPR
jgi:hypothetical protein